MIIRLHVFIDQKKRSLFDLKFFIVKLNLSY